MGNKSKIVACEKKEGSMTIGSNGAITMSYEEKDHLYEELRCIAGVLDMLFLINEADAWSMRDDTIGAVIMDARNRAVALSDQF